MIYSKYLKTLHRIFTTHKVTLCEYFVNCFITLFMKIKTLGNKSKHFPKLLAEVKKGPKRLHYLGEFPSDKPTVAIVGSRKHTRYGEGVTYRLAHDLAQAGIIIVSGLAYGLDTVAHRAALDGRGTTWAVLAHGLNRIHPVRNRELAKRILAQRGALITEHEAGNTTQRYHFAQRNVIVSGLSLGVVVTESSSKGGSLITASLALEQNRAVMAVPGNITSANSQGTNSLIKAGAIPVTCAEDVIEALDISTSLTREHIEPTSAVEAQILKLIKEGLNDTEDLLEVSKLSATEFNQTITLMEISGKVRNLGGGKWMVK